MCYSHWNDRMTLKMSVDPKVEIGMDLIGGGGCVRRLPLHTEQ